MAGTVRTHRALDVVDLSEGTEVTLAGWVARSRDMGGILFVDLRDASGVIQVVVDPSELPEAEQLRMEYCVAVTGTVRPRPGGTSNPDLATGDVEVGATGLEVLSPSDPLPFMVDDRHDVDELTRLEYRYLDFRRPDMAARLRARAAATNAMRQAMASLGFLEIETPTLIASTPEGARDMLVPSRLRQGSFYALPQSPQIFKQLLMVGGVERYFQFARCYRDEDFRSDRQLEFTQLDLEGAFWDEEDVRSAVEASIVAATAAVRPEASAPGFPTLTWREAIDRYGTDKPDVRFDMELTDLSEVFEGTEFRGFGGALAEGGVVKGMNAGALGLSRSGLDGLVERAKELGAAGLAWAVAEDGGSLRSPIAKFLSEAEVAGVVESLSAETDDVLLLIAGPWRSSSEILGQLRVDLGKPKGHDELAYLWVVDFPVFEETDDGGLAPAHHPFTAPHSVEEMRTDPVNALSRAYDLVLNGTELGSGSVRIHDPAVQAQVFETLGISDDEAERRFGWFLRALRYGTPPHAGFAVGFDRLMAILVGASSIRDVIPFPKTQRGVDPLTGSPSRVEEAQLEELGLDVRPEIKAAWEAD
ncbi:MAG: aspartate--tRNA ligase [Acidimicrobiia bacterium]|nr:MAG: aspartate--tRNA ligase [Acidimicrobiia bacterium]